jgi:predicted nuclease of predicted toxin-antitoxin system
MASRSNRPPPEARFLIDECLHRVLATVARGRGYDAAHVTAIGLTSTPDKLIAERAVQTGAIMVTNDARGYRRLYARFVSHPGLVIMLPSVTTPVQIRLFEAVIEYIAAEQSIVDQLVEIDETGRITVRPWPQPPA